MQFKYVCFFPADIEDRLETVIQVDKRILTHDRLAQIFPDFKNKLNNEFLTWINTTMHNNQFL